MTKSSSTLISKLSKAKKKLQHLINQVLKLNKKLKSFQKEPERQQEFSFSQAKQNLRSLNKMMRFQAKVFQIYESEINEVFTKRDEKEVA